VEKAEVGGIKFMPKADDIVNFAAASFDFYCDDVAVEKSTLTPSFSSSDSFSSACSKL